MAHEDFQRINHAYLFGGGDGNYVRLVWWDLNNLDKGDSIHEGIIS